MNMLYKVRTPARPVAQRFVKAAIARSLFPDAFLRHKELTNPSRSAFLR
jgi:hypothetical protein